MAFGSKDRTGFRAIIYKNIEGTVVNRFVSAEEAVDLALEGWHLSPSKAHVDPKMRDNMEFVEQTDMMSTDRMRMINLPMVSDKEALKETADRWLGIKLNPKHNLRSMKIRMKRHAMKLGIWEDSDGNS